VNLLKEEIHNRILEKKRELDALRPLPPDVVRKLQEQMQVEYTYNSNALEGNTLSLRETQLVIQEGVTVSGKSLREHLEAKNHPAAIEFVEGLSRREIEESSVLEVHRLLFEGIDGNAGAYRIGQVRITGADFLHPRPDVIREQVSELLAWLHENPDELRPIELAAVFHHRLVSIHPFLDGNGRVTRLLMNCVLLKNGYPFAVVLNNDRRRYYRVLSEADHGNLEPFVNFVARCVERSLNLYLTALGERTAIPLSEAAATTSYSQEYLSLLARKGRIDSFKIGRIWYVTRKSLDRYIQTHPQN
jgi:Fic family protein